MSDPRMTRAKRRYQTQKVHKRRDNLHKRIWSDTRPGEGMRHPASLETPKDCSGPCCGNPRRHFNEVTVQERRHGSHFGS